MSDEGEDGGAIQSKLDEYAENRRLIQSSHEFKKKLEELESEIQVTEREERQSTYPMFLGCRITKPMLAMEISETEFDLLFDFIKALSAHMEALSDWAGTLLQKGRSKKTAEKQTDTAREIISGSAIRLILLDYVLKNNTDRDGSSLTWFLHLAPQLRVRNPEYFEIFVESLNHHSEKVAELIVEKGLQNCAEEYLIGYFEEKQRQSLP